MHNVYLRFNGHAFLSDLGISNYSISPHWSAPEILNGDPYTEFADVYSFGLILFSLATGQDPYTGHLDDVSKKVRSGLRPNLPQNEIPKEYEELIRECWVQEIEKRPDMNKICLRLHAMQKGVKLPPLLQNEKESKQETKPHQHPESNVESDSSGDESPLTLKMKSAGHLDATNLTPTVS